MFYDRIDKGTLRIQVHNGHGADVLNSIEEIIANMYKVRKCHYVWLLGNYSKRLIPEIPPIEAERENENILLIKAKTNDQCGILDTISKLIDDFLYSDTKAKDIPCNGREDVFITMGVPCSSGEYTGE